MRIFSLSLSRVIFLIIAVLVGAVPLFFLPWTPEQFEFNKHALVVLGSAVLVLLWFAELYRRREVVVSSSRIHLFALLAFLAAMPAAFFSLNRFESIIGFGVTAHAALITLGAFLGFYVVASSTLTLTRALLVLKVFLASAFLAVGIAVLSFSGALARLLAPFAVSVGQGFTTVGALSSFQLFLAAALVVSLGVAALWRGRWQTISTVLFAVSFLFGIFVFSRAIWFSLLLAAGVMVGFFFFSSRLRLAVPLRGLLLSAFLFAIALVFVFLPPQLPGFTLPIEVSPSFPLSLEITKSVFAENLFSGVGQGQWRQAFAQHFPEALNQTPFWNTRFLFASSRLATLPAETGVLGAFFFGLLLLAVFATGISRIRRASSASDTAGSELAVLFPALMGWLVVVAGSFFVATGMTNEFLFWFFTALIAAVLIPSVTKEHTVHATETVGAVTQGGSVEERLEGRVEHTDESRASAWMFSFDARAPIGQALLFLLVIATVGVVALSAFITQRYLAGVSFARGVAQFNRGDTQAGLERLDAATRFESSNELYHRVAAEASLQLLLQESAKEGADPQRLEVLASRAITAANQTTQLAPHDARAWAQRARVLSGLLPFLGQDQRATEEFVASWQNAHERDPKNPFYLTELGGAYLLVAQRAFPAGQGGEQEDQRKQLFAQAEQALRDALALKEDYAPAHFQLAALARTRGDTQSAIAQLESAVDAVPDDPGLWFQLGVLYFLEEDSDNAKRVFERAVSLNTEYANARYYLGLLYDRAGARDQAIEQFAWLQEHNPEQEFLSRILENLRAGQPATAGFAPGEVPGVASPPLAPQPETVPPEPGL